MKIPHQLLFGGTMSLALAFGSLHLFVPDFELDFNRLHIFLFNLCAGGSILLFHAITTDTMHFGPPRGLPRRVLVYFALSLLYAISAFLELYPATLVLSVPLVIIVESVRIQRFGLFPFDFFRPVHTGQKFLQAALLCLSIGTTFASLVIINEEYLHLVHYEKLTMDVFFLGYSFPLSLLTFSVMYGFMKPEGDRLYMVLKEVSFWTINLGVVTFFVFIIFEVTVAEVVVSNTLLAAVIMTYWLFLRNGRKVQQKVLLVSGMAFLVATGVTGVAYLFQYAWPEVARYHHALLVLHATVSLYGWNLSGLFVVVRWDDFPILRRPGLVIALHWLTVLVLVPLGKYFIPFALVALPAYVLLLGLVFFSVRPREEPV